MRKKSILLSGIAILIALAVSVSHAQAVLTIVDSEVVTKFPMPGSQVQIKFTVKNIGEEQAEARTSLAVNVFTSDQQGNFVAGEHVRALLPDAKNIIKLNPNQTQTISAFAPIGKNGHHTGYASIYSEPAVGDKILVQNGTRRQHFMVVPPADLVLERAQFNHQGRLMLQMYNGGNRILDEYFEKSEIRVTIDNRAYKMMLRNAVPREFQNRSPGWMLGGSRRYTFAWPRAGALGISLDPSVKHKLEATLDRNYEINDSNRTNNVIKQEIGGKPDLVVCYRKSNHSKPQRYSTYRPYVKNIGFARSKKARFRFWIENKAVGVFEIGALDPGEEYRDLRRSVYWARRGTRKFRLTADFNKEVDEMFENNNIIEGLIYVDTYAPAKTDFRCSDKPGMTGFK